MERNDSDTLYHGEWVVKGSLREFVVNNRNAENVSYVGGFTHGELLEMALEDYGLDKKIEKVVLTYSLPASFYNKWLGYSSYACHE
ncbi:hypothetical protein Bca52824_040630 [Brassica carinata]|uniref:Uncharacterized protein n=1 Tax=Brassica carinata TaxID=52824 RepID=A0A8X7UZA0_BRACI|nr:hypothetical protein Bca52824_040630 [Brassica carinata]